MAYYKEETAKMSIIKTIQLLADKLETTVYFDEMDAMSYQQLTEVRDDLLSEYNQMRFDME